MRKMFRYVVPVDDEPHDIEMTDYGMVSNPAFVYAGDHSYVEFWALDDASERPITRTFQVFGTGQELPQNADFIETCQRENGLVFHLFEIMSRK